MSIIRVGSNKKFSEGWNAAFGGKKAGKKTETKTAAKKKTAGKKKK